MSKVPTGAVPTGAVPTGAVPKGNGVEYYLKTYSYWITIAVILAAGLALLFSILALTKQCNDGFCSGEPRMPVSRTQRRNARVHFE